MLKLDHASYITDIPALFQNDALKNDTPKSSWVHKSIRCGPTKGRNRNKIRPETDSVAPPLQCSKPQPLSQGKERL